MLKPRALYSQRNFIVSACNHYTAKAGVTAWLDAGIVVEQAYEGMSEREFRRFLRQGIKSLTVQGLRQKVFRGQDDGRPAAKRSSAKF